MEHWEREKYIKYIVVEHRPSPSPFSPLRENSTYEVYLISPNKHFFDQTLQTLIYSASLL